MYLYIMTALDNGLALTENGEFAMIAIPQSKLLSIADDYQILAISDKDTGLRGSYKDHAVLALIDIDACC